MSFNGQRYLTRGVQSEIPFELQMFMWHLIDELPEPRDYLQVFRLTAVDNNQQLIHEQEEPEYQIRFIWDGFRAGNGVPLDYALLGRFERRKKQ